MKFVPKDMGHAAENSSGDGTDGILKETLYMLLAHWAMMLAIVLSIVSFIAVAALLVWLFGN